MLISRFSTNNIEKEVEGFEKKYEFKFPPEYKGFLMKYNGGKTPETKFKINRVSSHVNGFFGLGTADQYFNYSFLEVSGSIKDFVADQVIPIAKNGFGDYIVLGTDCDRFGKVYYFYHDRPTNYIELADSFKDFVDKCKSKKVKPVESIEERKAYLIKNGKEANITENIIKLWQDEINEATGINQEDLVLD